MLKSMTAYGRASQSGDLGHFVAEIQSLNRKYLEMQFTLPVEFGCFDPEIRKWIEKRVTRGKVSLRLTAMYDSDAPIVVAPNLGFVRQMKQAFRKIAAEIGVEASDADILRFVAKQRETLQLTQEVTPESMEAYKTAIKAVINEALDQFDRMKHNEGSALEKDLLERLNILKQCIEMIEKKSPQAVEKHREKLLQRVQEFTSVPLEQDDSLMKEIAIYAERVDITEEITRFNSHLVQFEQVLSSDKAGVGKTLDFLIQEFNRETNTIGSKASDPEVKRIVIEIKSELEKMREQVQNVE